MFKKDRVIFVLHSLLLFSWIAYFIIFLFLIFLILKPKQNDFDDN